MLSSANFFPHSPLPAGQREHLLWLMGLVVAKEPFNFQGLFLATSITAGPLHTHRRILSPLATVVFLPSAALQRAAHFCAEIQSSVLEAAKHESGLCNELHLLYL